MATGTGALILPELVAHRRTDRLAADLWKTGW